MASRRELKKNANYVIDDLFAVCLASSMTEKANKKKANEIMNRIFAMQDEFISRISHTEPGNAKRFYKKYLSDFEAEYSEIIDAIDALN